MVACNFSRYTSKCYIMEHLIADRIGGNQFLSKAGYKMQAIKDAKQNVRMLRPEMLLLDFGIGEPDAMPPESLPNELFEQSLLPVNRGYADNGCQYFLNEAARYMSEVFHVNINPKKEILHCIGAKSALSILPLCLINPGDLVISTAPCYPVFNTHVQYLGGRIYSVPLFRRNEFLPDLTSIPSDTAKRAKVFSINYPNNPTSASATEEFFRDLVAFAKQYDLLIVNDAAYASLVPHKHPLSILQIPGAKERAVEIHSMSKAYNMTGWRLGWICGNPTIISAFALVKDNTDSGQFLAIQKAAAKVLSNTEFPRKMARKYQRRKRLIGDVLRKVGFKIFTSNSGFFIYAKLPSHVRCLHQEYQFSTADAFASWLLDSLGIVVVPWEYPEPSIRFSMTFQCYTETAFCDTLAERFTRVTVGY